MAEKASSTSHFCERMKTLEVRVNTCWGWTVTTPEVACLVLRESQSGLRYLAERTGVALSLRIACLIFGKSYSSSCRRKGSGRP